MSQFARGARSGSACTLDGLDPMKVVASSSLAARRYRYDVLRTTANTFANGVCAASIAATSGRACPPVTGRAWRRLIERLPARAHVDSAAETTRVGT